LTEKKQLLKFASVITLATVASRIFGYFRDQRIMLLLGTSRSADSFILAYRIPNLLRRLVGEGSMTASFIPVFTGYLAHRTKEEVWRLANRLFWTLALVLACVTALGVVFSPQVISLFTLFGQNRMQWDLAVYLNRIIFPYLFFISLAALAMAILNSFQIFGLPAASPMLLSISVIACSMAVVYRPLLHWLPAPYKDPAVALGIGVLIGGALQFLVQVPRLARLGMRFHFGVSFRDPGVREVGRLMVPGFFGIGIAQVNFFVDTIFATASKMPGGSITALYIADRVMELVLGSYAIAVATAILPMMSHQAAAGDFGRMKETFTFALRIVSFITIPAAVGLMVLREPIIRMLFQHGRFVAESTHLTARALLYYSMGLPAFAAVKLIVPAFYSTRDTRTPVRVAAGALALNIVLNVIFLRWFFEALRNGSPALATVLAAYFNFAALFLIFRRRFGRLGARRMVWSFTRVALAAAAMGGLCAAALRFSPLGTAEHLLPLAALLLVTIGVAAAFYLALTWFLRCHEIHEVFEIVKKSGLAPAGGPALLE
jgi:putative peptidoglycan lipid II flippase